MVRYWLYALELKIFKNKNSFLRPVKMMLLDQSIFPFLMNAAFLYFIGMTNGKSSEESVQDIKKVITV